MNFKLACADFTFPLLPHGRVLELISFLDVKGVDIGLFEGRSHLWPSKEFEDLEGAASRLKKQLDDLGLEPADVYLQMAPDLAPYAINHPDETRREHARDWFLKALKYASVLGARHISALPGMPFEDEEPFDVSRAKCIDELRWRVDQADKHGIVFGTEAHVGSIAPTPEEAGALVNDVPGLTLTLDYCHFTCNGTPDDRIEPLAEFASHFHVRGAANGRLQASFKDNVIDYKRVVDTLDEAGYSGYIGLEYVWIDWEHCNECDNLSETILYRDFFRGL